MGINPTHVYEAYASELGQPFIDLTVYKPEQSALNVISEHVARRYNVLPVKKAGDILYVAMGDTNNTAVAADLRLVSHCTVRGVLAVPEHITDAINRHYGKTQRADPLPEQMENALSQLIQSDRARWRGRSLVSLFDVSAEQVAEVLEVALRLKDLARQGKFVYFAHPKTLALLFEKPSLRIVSALWLEWRTWPDTRSISLPPTLG